MAEYQKKKKKKKKNDIARFIRKTVILEFCLRSN